jgi:hypothetical protein
VNKTFLKLPEITLKFIAGIGTLLCVAGVSGTVYRIVSFLDERIAAGITLFAMGVQLITIALFIGAYSVDGE